MLQYFIKALKHCEEDNHRLVYILLLPRVRQIDQVGENLRCVNLLYDAAE